MIDLNIEYTSEDHIDRSSDEDDDYEDSDIDYNHELNFENQIEGNTNVMEDDADTTQKQDNDILHSASQPSNPPREGMLFASCGKVIEFYHNFAKESGFQMKIRSRESDKGVKCTDNNECTRLRLACTKEGKFIPRGKDPTKPSRSQITGCQAKINATLDKKSGQWKLTTVVLEHNHSLDPLNSKFMSNYRFISPHNKEIIMTNEMAGIPIGRNYATFAVRYGGYGKVPFSEKDCRNLVTKYRRLSLQEGDFAAMEKHFIEMSIKDPNFFYMYDTNDDGSLKNVFWADGRCRAAYKVFGDVITFDTTYLKNRYRMPFCPFIGVNQHGQSTLLGCALISCEDTDNYIWLFKTFLACMSEKAPECILTDQCMAIGNAIKDVFPKTKHRWCIWHIMRNAKKHLNFNSNSDKIRKKMRQALHDSLSIEEFEKRWEDIGEKYKLKEVNWFNEMFNLRHRWVPVYFKDDFWAGMSSTQRSESMNNFFKSFVHLNTTLREFVQQYCLALGKRANDEELETFRSNNKPTLPLTEYVIESVFQRLYTSKKFEEFQEQVRLVTYTSAKKVEDDGRSCVYDVVTKRAKWPFLRQNKVTLDRVSFDVKCDCKNFEFRGIICAHIVRVYHQEDVACVPEKYILSRWRKDILRDYNKISVPYYAPDKNPTAERYLNLHKEFEEISTMATVDDKSYLIFMEILRNAKKQLKASAKECQEEPHSIDIIGKVYGRHPSQLQNDVQNGPDEGVNNQEKVKDPKDRRQRGKQPTHRKGYKNDHHSRKNNPQYQTLESNYGYGQGPIMHYPSPMSNYASSSNAQLHNYPQSPFGYSMGYNHATQIVRPSTSTYGNFMTSHPPFHVMQVMSSSNTMDPQKGGEKRLGSNYMDPQKGGEKKFRST
ncbi:unnamed protein product [Amaranthus hypochondriacus]